MDMDRLRILSMKEERVLRMYQEDLTEESHMKRNALCFSRKTKLNLIKNLCGRLALNPVGVLYINAF